MIFFYETMGWWRLSSSLKRVHFKEDENEFAHLLIVEALGGDQNWFDRFIGQHSALIYYVVITLMWLISPTLAYNFSELIETHAVVTYSEFVDQNKATLKTLPPPAVALDYYGAGGALLRDASEPSRCILRVFCSAATADGALDLRHTQAALARRCRSTHCTTYSAGSVMMRLRTSPP
jgi:ubiquinol oxidase